MRDGWLIWPCWLTDSGRLNHRVVSQPASSLAQDMESSPAETSVLTTILCCSYFLEVVTLYCDPLPKNVTFFHSKLYFVYTLPKSSLRSLDFVVVRFVMKLFKPVNNEIIRECCSYFKFSLPSELLDKMRRVKFRNNFMLCTGILSYFGTKT